MPHSYPDRTSNSTRRTLARLRVQSRRRQGGMTMFGGLILLCVVAFVVSIALKIVPHYIENRAIVGIVDGMSPEVWRGSIKKKMYDAVDKGLKVNNIRTLKSKDVLEIERTPSVTKVVMDYEIREKLFGNIDVVLVFKKDYQF